MRITIAIKQVDDGRKRLWSEQDIISRLAAKFDNKESFCARLDVHCLDIAKDIGCIYTRQPNDAGPDTYIFDFTNTQEQ